MRVQLTCYKQPKIFLKEKTSEIAPAYDGTIKEGGFSKITKDFFNSSLISFKGVDRNPEHFEVKKAYGLDCPCCGQVMLTKKQLNAFTSRIADKKGEDLQKELLKEMNYYRPNEKAIAEILIEESRKDPDAGLKELVSRQKENSKAKLEKAQKMLIGQIEPEISNLDEPLKESLKSILDEARATIDNSNDASFFRRKFFIQEVKELLESESEENSLIGQKIISLAEKMPSSNTSIDAFFVKYSRRENKEIAARLVWPSLITTEHVRPQSYDGADNTENYIPLCSECNSKRGNTSYNVWFKIHPEMPANLQKFLNQISTMIQNGEFQGFEYYDTYVEDVIKAIKEATGGALVLKTPNKEDKEEQDEPPFIADASLSIEERRELWIKRHAKKLAELTELEKKKEELENDAEYLNILEYLDLVEKSKSTATKKALAQSELNKKNRRLRSRQDALERAEKKEDRDENAISDLKRVIKEIEEEIKALKIDFVNIKAKSDEFDERLGQIKKIVSPPATIQLKIIKFKKRLEELDKAKSELKDINRTIDDEDDIIIELSYLNSEIQQRLFYHEGFGKSIDFDNEDNKQMMQSYFHLRKQMASINSVNIKQFRSAFDSKDDISPDFILEYAKEHLEGKIALISRNEAVKYLIEEDEIKALKERKEELSQQLMKYDQLKARRTVLLQQIKQIKNGSSEKQLKEKLEALIEAKARVTNKFQLANIDERINSLKSECSDLLQKYAESFETDYQHSNSNVDTSSSSSAS